MEIFKDEKEIGTTAEAAKVAQQIINIFARNKTTLCDALGAIVIVSNALADQSVEDKFSDRDSIIACIIRSLCKNMIVQHKDDNSEESDEITDDFDEETYSKCLNVAELMAHVNMAFSRSLLEKWFALAIGVDVNLRASSETVKKTLTQTYKDFMSLLVTAREYNQSML